MSGNRKELVSLFRLAAVMTILCILTVIAATRIQQIPFIGNLPGDFEVDLPGVSLYLPVARSILVAFSLSVIAFFFHDSSNNDD